jgi:lipoate-protein ligase A
VTGSWPVVHLTGPAGALHAESAAALSDAAPRRVARLLSADRPTMVLGSNQPEAHFDPGALQQAGLALTRRRSGGGAVLVGPGHVLWADFVVPAGDPLWDDDVGRAAWWVGDLWARALLVAGRDGTAVWKGPMRPSRWSPVVCFAGLGPGEVTVDGRKMVGVSQRRNRRAVLFQTAALLDWRPRDYLDVVAPGVGGTHPELAGAAAGVGVELAARLSRALSDLLAQ